MALKKLIDRNENAFHAAFPEGYHRIVAMATDKTTGKVTLRVVSHADEAARRYAPPAPMMPGPGGIMRPDPVFPRTPQEGAIQDTQVEFSIDQMNAVEYTVAGLASDREMAVGYALLKTTNRFAEAEDC